jgi:hypothetical protein
VLLHGQLVAAEYKDVNVLMRPRGPAHEQVERQPAGDPPGDGHAREDPGKLIY